MTTNLSVALISFMKQGSPGEATIEGANICCRATWYQASVTWQIGVAVIEASRCSTTALEALGGEEIWFSLWLQNAGFQQCVCDFLRWAAHLSFTGSVCRFFFLFHTKKFFLFLFFPFFQKHLHLSWVFIVQTYNPWANLYLLLPGFDNSGLPALSDFSKNYLVFMRLLWSSQRSRSTLEVASCQVHLS